MPSCWLWYVYCLSVVGSFVEPRCRAMCLLCVIGHICVVHFVLSRDAFLGEADVTGGVGITQTGLYQTGSHQKGHFIPPKPKWLNSLCFFLGEPSQHTATTDTYFWGRSSPRFANLALGSNPVWYDPVYTRSPSQDSRLEDFRHGLGCSDMFFSLVAAKIFQGLGPKRRESSFGDRVYTLPRGGGSQVWRAGGFEDSLSRW